MTDRELSKIVRDCQELPVNELFHSEDVNEYLREISGAGFTAKDFRASVGTSQTALELEQIGPAESAADGKRKIVGAIRDAAAKLGTWTRTWTGACSTR